MFVDLDQQMYLELDVPGCLTKRRRKQQKKKNK
jgi:hypothetical protein